MLSRLPPQPLARVRDIRRGSRPITAGATRRGRAPCRKRARDAAGCSPRWPRRSSRRRGAAGTGARELPSLDVMKGRRRHDHRRCISVRRARRGTAGAAGRSRRTAAAACTASSPRAATSCPSARIAWTEVLLADGYAVLWPDSFNSRGRRSVCLVKRGEPSIAPFDAPARHPRARSRSPRRNQASIASGSRSSAGRMAAARRSLPSTARIRAVAKFFAGARCAVAASRRRCVLSGLRRVAAQGRRLAAVDAASIHTGELDDWTPSPPCVALGDAARRTRRGHEGRSCIPDASSRLRRAAREDDGVAGSDDRRASRQGRDARTESRWRATRQRRRCATFLRERLR